MQATEYPIDTGSSVGRAILTKSTIHIADVLLDPNYVVGDLANGMTTLVGGWALDRYLGTNNPNASSMYFKLFVAGFIARVLAIPLLAWLVEPGARRLREMVAVRG